MAGNFGAGQDLDVYFTAFRIPDFIYNVMIAGGIVVAFMPLFSEYFLKNKEEAWRFAANVLNIFLLFLILLCGVFALFAPQLLKIIAPGFEGDQFALTVLITRILFLSPVLLGLSSVFSGVLQYFNKFLTYALAPVFYNLGIIAGIIFWVPDFGILGVVFGVVFGALLHLLVQVPAAISAGFSFKPIFALKDEKIKKVFSLMLPRTLGVAVPQINLMVVTAIASLLPAGALSVFTFSNNIQQIPMGLLGIPFATAAFPVLSRAWAAGQKMEFKEKFSEVFRKIIFIAIPSGVFVFIFRNEIIRLILKTGRFDQGDTALAGACLGLFSLGIFASCLMPLFFRSFFSMQDTKTPTIVAIFIMALNVALCFLLTHFLGFQNAFQEFIRNIFSLQGAGNIAVLGLPLAFSIDVILQFALLFVILSRKLKSVKVGGN